MRSENGASTSIHQTSTENHVENSICKISHAKHPKQYGVYGNGYALMEGPTTGTHCDIIIIIMRHIRLLLLGISFVWLQT